MHSVKKRVWIEIALHIVFWVGVFYTLRSLNSSHLQIRLKGSSSVTDQYTNYNNLLYVYLILIFLAVLFYGNIFWIFRKAIRYKNGMIRLALCAAWFTVVFTANYFIVGPVFDKAFQPDGPQQRFRIVRKFARQMPADNAGNVPPPGRIDVGVMITSWKPIQPIILLAFLAIMGISIAYFFLKEWAKSELIQTQLQAHQLSTEIKFLKSQINPHFLFNTLNNLFSMAQGKGNDELADGTSKLSDMMRYMLYESNAEIVPLKQEIEYLQSAITLSKLRYADDEANVLFSYPEQTDELLVAPMLFIPFIENAFKHGVIIGQSSAINIVISIDSKQLTFSCENNNYSFIKKMENIGGIGLENVKRRLELVYPGRHKLLIKNDIDNYSVRLEIDLA
jgi:two-component system, LytTR family, sensor kinase